jgi:hypothetical protein
MSSWSGVGKPSWRMCAGIAPSLHCTVRLRPSGPLSAGPCWIKPSSGSVWRSPSLKPISTSAAAGITVRDRQPRDTPRRDGKPPVGAKRICARRQDGRVRRPWPHKSLHATKAAGRHPDRSVKGDPARPSAVAVTQPSVYLCPHLQKMKRPHVLSARLYAPPAPPSARGSCAASLVPSACKITAPACPIVSE